MLALTGRRDEPIEADSQMSSRPVCAITPKRRTAGVQARSSRTNTSRSSPSASIRAAGPFSLHGELTTLYVTEAQAAITTRLALRREGGLDEPAEGR